MTFAEDNALRTGSAAVRGEVEAAFRRVAREQDKILPSLSNDLVLTECDLDSLCFAIIVARLEDTLGYDPFSIVENAEFPVTFGDFVAFYESGVAVNGRARG